MFIGNFDTSQKIIVLEGLDGTGKSALANELAQLLNGKAIIKHFSNSVTSKIAHNTLEEAFKVYNSELTETLSRDSHEVIILDRSWLSGEATRFAEKKDLIRKWPKDLYTPTHLFLLKLPEIERLKHISNRLNSKPLTNEEIRLKKDPQYREDYERALLQGAKSLGTSTIIRVLDGSILTIKQMADKIINLLDCNRLLLDPRKLATGDKFAIRNFYQSWEQRLNETPLPSEFISIYPDCNKVLSISDSDRKKHQCHFDNIGKLFDYNAFSKPRHPPLPIGFLNNQKDFDFPFRSDTPQAQDMPIAFPSINSKSYEYRLPASYSNLSELVQKVANIWCQLEANAHEYFAYLTISHSEVPSWVAQRRPTIHCDGFQSSRIEPKLKGEYAFVVSNTLPTSFYVESFDVSNLDPSRDNFFTAFNQQSKCDPINYQNYEIVMMDPYCMHTPIINSSDETITRTFARIIFSTREYDRLGNTHNFSFDYNWKMVRREAQLDLANPLK